jgi:hypothetical protein
MAIRGFERQLNGGSIPQGQPAKQKGFFTDQISTAGGIGGALAGAAGGALAGSALFPGVGTVIGGLIGSVVGGAGGSAGGQVAENAITGDNLGKGVAQEALLGGVFSAPPIRAGKAVFGAGKALLSGAGKDAAKTAAETALTKPGLLSGIGANLRGGARGVSTGVKVGGERLAPTRVKEINSFIENTVKAKGLTAAKQSESVENFIKLQNDTLTNAITQANRKITTAEKKTIVENLKKRSGNIIGIDAEDSKIVDDLVTRINQAPDVKSLDDIRKFIDSGINFSRGSSSVTPSREQLYRNARSLFTDEVASRAPGVKGIKTNLSKAFDAQDLLLQNSTGGFGQAQTSIGTIPLPRQAGQALQSVAGKTLGLVSGGNPLSGLNTATRLGTVGAIGGLGNQSFEANTATASNTNMMNPNNIDQSYNTLGGNASQLMQTNPDGSFGPAPFGATNDTFMSNDPSALNPPSNNPYPQANLLFDLQRDPANAKDYIAQYQTLQEIFGAQAQEPLSQTAITAVSGFDSSLQNLDNVESVLAENSGAFDPIIGRLRSLNPYDDTSSRVNQATLVAAQNIGRALEGGKLTDADIARYQAALPNITDTPQQAQAKINNLRQLITQQKQNYLGLQQNNGGGANTLQDMLMQGGF